MAQDTLISFTNLLQVLNEYGEAIRNEYQDNLIRSDKVASGELLNSVEFEVTQDRMRFKVNLSLAKYWEYVENGTPPHLPPVSAILQWIKVKPILPKPRKGKLPTPLQLAFAIRNSIGEEGTKGSYDLENATKTIFPIFLERIQDAFAKDVGDNIELIIKQYF